MVIAALTSKGACGAYFAPCLSAVWLPGTTGRLIDLRDEASVAAFFEDLGGFDHLAIAAGDWGGAMFASIAELDLVWAREALEVRFRGAVAAAKHSRGKIAQDGSITLTSGILAHRPVKGAPIGTALIGAVEHLARGLRSTWCPCGSTPCVPALS